MTNDETIRRMREALEASKANIIHLNGVVPLEGWYHDWLVKIDSALAAPTPGNVEQELKDHFVDTTEVIGTTAGKVEVETRKKEELVRELRMALDREFALQTEVSRRRQIELGNSWYWQGAEDHLETIVCQIIIKPTQMRDALDAAKQAGRDEVLALLAKMNPRLRCYEIDARKINYGNCLDCGADCSEEHTKTCIVAAIQKAAEGQAT